MRICGISDMHGNLDFTIPNCDLLLICGDIVPLRLQFYTQPSFEWLKTTFLKWLEQQPCDKAVIVGGNHDWAFERHPKTVAKILEGSKADYLDCSAIEYQGKVIYGTPLCHKFGNWAFMRDDKEQAAIYSEAIESHPEVDILIAHDAPYGTSDILLQPGFGDGQHIGCQPLADLVKGMQPKLMLHGHLHSTNHDKEMLGNTEIYNVSLLDENYKMVYQPFITNLS